MNAISAERVRYWLDYNEKTGIFTWRMKPSNRVQIGDRAGTFSQGRWRISLEGRVYLASRLAWAWMTGEWPEDEIDHRNLDKADDCFENLRPASRPQNGANRPLQSNNTTGMKGVCFDKSRNKWIATITVNGRQKNLGRFATAKAAHDAYAAAARTSHGEFARI